MAKQAKKKTTKRTTAAKSEPVRVTVYLPANVEPELDAFRARVRQKTGAKLTRTAVVAALVAGLKTADVELEEVATAEEFAKAVRGKLRGYRET